jgi:hypothetical protein
MGGKNKDRKAGDWHTISTGGPRGVSGRRGGAFRPAPDPSAALLPISGPARKRREAVQRCGTLERHSTSSCLFTQGLGSEFG